MKEISTPLKLERRKLSDLKEWASNPRSINNDAFERLKTQITTLGVYKPLIVDQDNTILGGNMRFKALVDLDVKEIDVIVRVCKDDAERVSIALSDNDRAGYYNETELAELVELNQIDGELYSIDLTESKTVDEILNAEPSDLTDDKEVDPEKLLTGKTHTCPHCGFEFTAEEEKAAKEPEE